MFGFGIVVAAERGLLNSTRKSNLKLLKMAGVKPVSAMIRTDFPEQHSGVYAAIFEAVRP